MDRILFISLHAAELLGVVIVIFGLGALVHRPPPGEEEWPPWLQFGLTATLGMGVLAVSLQLLALLGLLNGAALAALALLGAGSALRARGRLVRPRLPRPASTAEAAALLLLAAALLATLLAPFRPGIEWDEVMYHLPHAAQWAQAGRLTINEWLRYPWFPYNFNLLYAATLLISDGVVLAHLLHALAGWLCTLLIFQSGARLGSPTQGAIAAAIWLFLSVYFYENALIDMGVTLFVFAACLTFAHWWQRPAGGERWLLGAAFLLGVAAGSKYQALMFLPLFGLALLARERRPRVVLAAVAAFALPCIYWYARNALTTGDPFNPLGGPLFGFTDWNRADYDGQVADVRRGQLPHWLLWPLLLVPFLRQARSFRPALLFTGYTLLVWYLMTGGFTRYLMPAFPVLVLLAARGWAALGTLALQLLARPWGRLGAGARAALRFGALAALAAGLTHFTAAKMRLDWGQIAATAEQQDGYLRAHIPGYPVFRQLAALPFSGIYQVGVENALYYAPRPVWGDHFGPARYNDLIHLPADAFARALAGKGMEILVVGGERYPWIAEKPAFARYFEPLVAVGTVTAYRVRAEGASPPQRPGFWFWSTAAAKSGPRP